MTASVLNIHAEPRPTAAIVGQVHVGAVCEPKVTDPSALARRVMHSARSARYASARAIHDSRPVFVRAAAIRSMGFMLGPGTLSASALSSEAFSRRFLRYICAMRSRTSAALMSGESEALEET